jgi:hypothetical protein
MQDVDEDFKTFWDRLLVEEDEPSGGRWDSGGTGFRPNRSSKSSLPFLSPTRNGFIRPPIFGPEKVVLDPTIKAVHQKVMNEILSLGLCAAVVSNMFDRSIDRKPKRKNMLNVGLLQGICRICAGSS